MSTGTYPPREPFFAHRFVRLLTKTAAAQELGPEAAWLLTVVAHQEDAKRYSGAVTYWNEQLMPLCGFGSKGRLIRARQAAADAGWLHYETGGRKQAGRYWCMIPAEFELLPDGACDESEGVQNRTANQSDPFQNRTANGTDNTSTRSKIERKTELSRNQSEALSTLYPNPSPTTSLAGANDGADVFSEFVKAWNESGLTQCRKLTDKRKKALRARLSDSDWRDSWREALTRASKSSFCRGAGSQGWKADVDWFLRPDSVVKLLEGKYDDQKPQTGQRTASDSAAIMQKHTQQVLEKKRAEQAALQAAQKGGVK